MANIESLNIQPDVAQQIINPTTEEIIDEVQIEQVLNPDDQDLPPIEVNGQLLPARYWARDYKVRW